LYALGYTIFPAEESALQVLEVYPYAAYTVLLGLLPFPKYSLEGRLQRQLALYELKVRLPDAMLYFEEITRHRLLKGILPAENLFSPGELDALVAAYTAWLVINHADQASILGDVDEGQIVLPAGELKSHYTYPGK
jgi:predicted RNase H-like nuclease